MQLPELIDILKGLGLVIAGWQAPTLLPKIWDFAKSVLTGKIESRTTLQLAEKQIAASKEDELKAQVNKLLIEWQQVLIECKERESQLGIQQYINADLVEKIKALKEELAAAQSKPRE